MASDAASARVGLAPSSVDGESLCRGAEESRRASVASYEEDGMAKGWPRERCCRRRAHCDVVAAMAAPAAPELVLRPVLEVHSARWRARRGSSETGSAPMYLDRRSPALSHTIKGAPLSALRIRHTTLLSGGEGAGDGGGEGGGGGAGGGVPRKCKHGRRRFAQDPDRDTYRDHVNSGL